MNIYKKRFIAFAESLDIPNADQLPDQNIKFSRALGKEITRRGTFLRSFFNSHGGEAGEICKASINFLKFKT